ncbi:Conserved hypothetical, protein [Geosmithia morbida]|uniref:Conserved hypothetical, protein n=1 Tax=Geosmithia morbida TaxID=1094350 RepID=A0A9P4YRW8_9HYPO|nr:Conserved hypothetical, protein [Geosmithia morbida]KAF4120506.1 Conserved hypothetical, protein [Geosmithia morbida]
MFLPGPAPADQDGEDGSQESRSPRPANYRRSYRGPAGHGFASIHRQDLDADDGALAHKRPRLDSSPEGPVPSVTSSTSFDTVSEEPPPSALRRRSGHLYIEIDKGDGFDASEYQSVQGSQEATQSQSVSELESQDRRVVIVPDTIPDSQDPSSIESPEPPRGALQPSQVSGEVQLIIPDSQGDLEQSSSPSPPAASIPAALPSGDPESTAVPASAGVDQEIPSHQDERNSVQLPDLAAPSAPPAAEDAADQQKPRSDLPPRSASPLTQAGSHSGSEPAFFTQPAFIARSQATQSQSREDSPVSFADPTSADAAQSSPQVESQVPNLSQAAQILDRRYQIDVQEELDRDNGSTFGPGGYPDDKQSSEVIDTAHGKEASQPPPEANVSGQESSHLDPAEDRFTSKMFPSHEDGPPESAETPTPSRIDQLRSLWYGPEDEPGYVAPSQNPPATTTTVDPSALVSSGEGARPQYLTQAGRGPDSWREPPIIQGFMTSQSPPASGSLRDLQDPPPGTVSPADVSKPGETERSLALLPSLGADPADLSPAPFESSDNAVTMAQAPPQTDVGTPASPSPSVDDDDDGGNNSSNRHPREEDDPVGEEYTVTLPLQASMRQLYYETMLRYKHDITAFGDAFHSEEFVPPAESLVKTVDELLGRLQSLCDYPEDLIGTSIESMSPKDKTKYATDSNAKFSFLYEFLQHVTKQTNVLVVVQSANLLRPLCDLVETLGLECSCGAVGRHHGGGGSDAYSTVHVAIALADGDDYGDYTVLAPPDLIIGYDSAFDRSRVASSLLDRKSDAHADVRPPVLRLVTSYTIEHIEANISDASTGLERKGILLFGLVKARRLINEPPQSLEPYEVARMFADYVNGDEDALVTWEPAALPDDVLDVYLSSQSATQQHGVDHGRKRKLDEDEDEEEERGDAESKRIRRLSRAARANSAPLPDEVRKLLEKAGFKGETTADESQVGLPISILETLAAQMAEAQRAAEANDLEKEYKSTIDRLDRQVKEFESSMEQVYENYRNAIQDRTAFEQQAAQAKAALQTKTDEAAKAADKWSGKIADLEAKVARLTGEGAVASTEKLLQETQAKSEVLERRLETSHKNEEYARQLYQDATQATSAMRSERDDLRDQNAELARRASDNLRSVHEIQRSNVARDLTGQIAELNTRLTERESELDRVREELRVLRASRRETRQVSVPRSPHMSGMSPRAPAVQHRSALGGVGSSSASRGASPTPGPPPLLPADVTSSTAPTTQLTSPQGGVGRWGHLR